MHILYDRKGKKVKFNFLIDVQAALQSGEYFKQNPFEEKNNSSESVDKKEDGRKRARFGKSKDDEEIES